MPATNGSREVDDKFAAVEPTLFTPTSRAIGTSIHSSPSFALSTCTPFTNPCSPLTASLGSATSSAIVPPIYPSVTIVPPTRIAHGIVLRGFWISSPIGLAPSRPPNAKNTPDQNTALSRDQCGIMLARVNGVAGPNRIHDTAAIIISRASGTRLPIEQMLLSHLPASTPRMFSTMITVSQNAANPMKYSGLLFKCAARGPNAINTDAAPK